MRLYGGVRYIDAPSPANVRRLDHGCLPMIHAFHRNGIRLDITLLHTLSAEIVSRQQELESFVSSTIGDYQYVHAKHGRQPFQIGSRDHLSQLLFEHLRIQGDDTVQRTEKGKRFEVSDDTLEPYKKLHPSVPAILEWHQIQKIKDTYTDTLPLLVDSESRIHTQFNATVTATGRLSSSRPNLQNIPVRSTIGRRVREAFIPSPGCVLVSADLSQIEMRWAAHGSQDATMIDVFHRNEDIHARTACGVFGRDYDDVMGWDKESEKFKQWKKTERAPSKNLGFGVLYGLTARGLRRNIFTESAGEIDWDESACQTFIDQFFTMYPGLKIFMDLQYRRARRDAMVWDAFGRVRLVPEAKSIHKRIANEGERKAGNHFEQSSAQGTIKLGMAELTPLLDNINRSYTCLPLLQIHDQLITEVDTYLAEEVAAIKRGVLSNVCPLIVPVDSSYDIGNNWAEL